LDECFLKGKVVTRTLTCGPATIPVISHEMVTFACPLLTLFPCKHLFSPGVGQPIQLAEVPAPQPGPGEVLVQLKAAALNHRDV
jgi:hypothetical protein